MGPLPEPVGSIDPAEWLVYADSLYEFGRPERLAEQARRVARALAARPPLLVLVACARRARFRFFGLEFGQREETFPVQPGSPTAWPELRSPRWWTPRAAKRRFMGARPATPAEFPGLVEQRPQLARAFFRRLVRGEK